MKTALNRKITGAFFKGEKWEDFPDKMINYFLPQYPRFISYKFITKTLGNYADDSFGTGGGIFDLENNMQELLNNYETMKEDAFFVKANGYKMKIPREVMDIFIQKLTNPETL